MLLLRNPIQPYAWGPIDGISRLVGSEPTGDREAELWVGTHPRGPSVVAAGEHEGRTLADVIAEDPVRWLGPEVAATGATALPFLLKVLAIGEPLSLQAHPSAQQAEAGFAREEAAGVAIDAPDRSYRDANPKPEALVATRDSWALCGFREADEAGGLLAMLRIDALRPFVDALESAGSPGAAADALHALLGWLLRLEEPLRADLAHAVGAAVADAPTEPTGDLRYWVHQLAQTYPGDPLALAPMILNVLPMPRGQAVHLPAGNLHAYLRGAGVEIMAASDNVLRGGLTPKHVDVDELLDVLHFEPGLPESPRLAQPDPAVTTYDAGEEAFSLAVVQASAGPVELAASAPTLLLATSGAVSIDGPEGSAELDGGAAAYVPPGTAPIQITGSGWLWWASTGAGLPR